MNKQLFLLAAMLLMFAGVTKADDRQTTFNLTDITYVINAISNNAGYDATADINKDGRVDIADVIFLLAGLNEDPSDKTVNITEAQGWLE